MSQETIITAMGTETMASAEGLTKMGPGSGGITKMASDEKPGL